MEKELKTNRDERVKITMGEHTVDAHKSVAIFYELMQTEEIEIKDLNELVFDYMKFIQMWQDFKAKSDQDSNLSEYESSLNKHILCHTIKPDTQYSDQQDMKDGKPVLYPVYYFAHCDVHSAGCGGNYPIDECDFFVKTKQGGYTKIN